VIAARLVLQTLAGLGNAMFVASRVTDEAERGRA
jgi:hypothetical protein